jgi:hypothetical protein
MRALSLLAIGVLSAGCGEREIHVTVALSSLSAALEQQASSLDIHVRGAEVLDHSFAAPAGGFSGDARFVYRGAVTSGTLAFTAELRQALQVIACGSQSVVVPADGIGELTVPMAPGGGCLVEPPDDLGVPDAAADGPLDDGGADGGDGGSGDGGEVASSCDTPGWILCDGFEGATLAAGWSSPGEGTVVPDSLQHRRGKQALHITMPAGDADLGFRNVDTGIDHAFAAAGPFYVRFFVYYPLSSRPIASDLVVFGDNPAEVGLGTDTSDVLGYGPYGSFDYDFPYSTASNDLLPTNTWTCLEWLIDPGSLAVDMGNGQTKVWMNDVELTNLETGGIRMPEPGRIHLLLDRYVNVGDPPREVWIDEVAIADHPIGCKN